MNSTTSVNISTWTFAHQQSEGSLVIIMNYAHLILLEGKDAVRLLAELSTPETPATVEAWPVVDDLEDDGMFFAPKIAGECETIALNFPNDDREAFITSVLSSPYLSLETVEAPEAEPVALNA